MTARKKQHPHLRVLFRYVRKNYTIAAVMMAIL